MAQELIMNVTPGETRIARLENGVLGELSIERDAEEQVAGNIYYGRINRVLPGMQAAFVDIGLEKAAFLYVGDIVSDMFEGIEDEDFEESDDNKKDAKDSKDSNSKDNKKDSRRSRGKHRHKDQKTTNDDDDSQNDNSENSDDQNSNDKGRRGKSNDKNDKGRGRGRGRRRRGPLPKIEDVVKEGQTILVQVVKEPMSTKGARITSHISIPGRYLVYMPTVNHVGVSRRISSYEERMRLKEILSNHQPGSGGFIARTSCVGATEEQLVQDMKNLTATWQKIHKQQQRSKAPALVHADLDIVKRVVRDNLSQEIERLVIDSKEEYDQVMDFVNKFMPDMANRVQLFDKDSPIFDVYGIEAEINRALGKKVWLKSGGYLIIESSEALTSIDINTGRFVGKQDFDETILTTNLEAAEEIAYQLKLRSIGGIIIIDFIDMNRYSHRMKVYRALKDALRKDKTKTTISKITDLGLIEMTRKRTHESLTQMLSMTCSECHGTGFIKTPLTVAFEIFREIKRVYRHISTRSLLLKTHPKVAKVLFNEGRDRLEQIEKHISKRIVVESEEAYHVEKFEIRGRTLND